MAFSTHLVTSASSRFLPPTSPEGRRRAGFFSCLGRARAEDGVATVELALVAVVFLLIVVGIVYFGRVINYATDATHLANVAARWAAINNNPCSSQNVTLTQCVLNQVDTAELKNGSRDVTQPASLSFCLPNTTANYGDPIQATVTFKFHFLPLFKFGSSIATVTVTRKAVMMIEQPPGSNGVYNASAPPCP